MSAEKEKNVLSIRDPKGTIEVRPHPEDVIEVDPQIIAVMEARLQGKSFDQIFGDEDKVSQEFLLRKEREKLIRVFGKEGEVFRRYQSVKRIGEVRRELAFEDVDYVFLNQYALRATHGEFVDEVDLFRAIIAGVQLQTKNERLANWRRFDERCRCLFSALSVQYLSSNLSIPQITKEVIQLVPFVADLVRADVAVGAMDELLASFYGESQ